MKRVRVASISMLGSAMALCAFITPAQAGERPLSDFLSRQGAFCLVFNEEGFDCAASYYDGPPCEGDDRTRFTFPLFWSDPTGRIAVVDTLGDLDKSEFGGNFGTSVTGSISESARRGGGAQVTITLHTQDALMVAFDENGDQAFGTAQGDTPTLGDALVQIKLTNPTLGAPLPDMTQLNFCPLPGQALETFSINARAKGPLHEVFGVAEGTPGQLHVIQTGLIGTAGHVNPHSTLANDAYPAEQVTIRATGR
jgi:hypothetical protein